jgi:hypothetical protein
MPCANHDWRGMCWQSYACDCRCDADQRKDSSERRANAAGLVSQAAQSIPNEAPTRLLDRVASIVMLDGPTYEAVKRDPAATRQATLIVLVVMLAAAINELDNSILWRVVSLILGVMGWPLGSWLTFLIGTRLLGARPVRANWVQMLRLDGFVRVTSLVTLARPVDVLGPILYYSATAWALVLSVKAIKHVLSVSTGRAIAISLISTIVILIPLAAIYLSFWHWHLL